MKTQPELDFEAIFNSLPAPFLVMDRDFNIAAVNQAFLDATMRSREALLGVNIFASFPGPEESRKILQASLERARDQGVADVLPTVSYAIAVNGRSEERLWSCTHVPVRDKSGNVAFVVKNTQDISELHPSKGLAGLPSLGPEPRPDCAALPPGSVHVLNQTLLATVHHLRRLVMQAPSFMCVLRGPDLVFELVNIAFSMLAGGRDLIGLSLIHI